MSEVWLRSRLVTGLEALDITASEDQIARLLTYLTLLEQWNRRFNLTAVREPAAMVTRHLLDSLAILPHLPEGSLVDVGSGAGLPGIPLAIMRPSTSVSVVDSNGKKTRFMLQAKSQLGLDNLAVHKSRVEDLRPDAPFAVVVSRAFASLNAMISACTHLTGSEGVFLAMKGVRPDAELADLDPAAGVVVDAVIDLSVPGLEEERCLVRLVRDRP